MPYQNSIIQIMHRFTIEKAKKKRRCLWLEMRLVIRINFFTPFSLILKIDTLYFTAIPAEFKISFAQNYFKLIVFNNFNMKNKGETVGLKD